MNSSEDKNLLNLFLMGPSKWMEGHIARISCPYCTGTYAHLKERRDHFVTCLVCKGSAERATVAQKSMMRILDSVPKIGFEKAHMLMRNMPGGYYEFELIRRISNAFPAEWNAYYVPTSVEVELELTNNA